MSNTISRLYGQERKANDPDSFEKKAKLFHTEISPFLINELLPKRLPKVHERLVRHTIMNGPIRTLPYVNLLERGRFSLSDELSTSREELKVDNDFVTWMRENLGKIVNDNPTFRLMDFSHNGKLNIGIGSYESTISTADKNYFDLIRYFPDKKYIGSVFSYKYNKNVKKWLDSIEKIIKYNNFSHYTASIGCSVLTVMPSSDGEYKYLIKRNSLKKSSSASEKHVIPSFMFQPVSTEWHEQEKEIDLNLSVLREYGEEIIGLPELEEASTVDTLKNYIRSNDLLKILSDQIENGNAYLVVTGLTLDIFRLRPEITFVLVITDKRFAENVNLNWESKGSAPEQPFLHDDNAYNALIHDDEYPLCPPGLAALINGRSLAIKLLKDRNADSF